MATDEERREALVRTIRPWTLCDDGGGFDHGSERAADAALALFAEWSAQDRAEAWERGRGEWSKGHHETGEDGEPIFVFAPNPYRAATTPGGER